MQHSTYFKDKQIIDASMLDANEGLFFLRQLEYIKAQTYDVLYPDLIARYLFPVSNEGGPGVSNITYNTFDKVALAGFVGSNSRDLVRADINGKQTTLPIHEIGVSFAYTMREIQAAAARNYGNISIEQKKAEAAKRGVEQLINQVAYFGDAERNIVGFLNNPEIPTGNATGVWTALTPPQVVADINRAVATIYSTTLKIWKPNTLLLPVDKWSYIMQTPWSQTQASDTTIAQFFAKNNAFGIGLDDIIPVNELDGVGTGGTDVLIAYRRDPGALQLSIPMELQFLPIQYSGLEFLIPGHSYFGGVNLYYPNSVFIMEGI